MHWILLVIAGLFEIAFTSALKMSEGFTKLWPSLAFVGLAVISFAFLNLAIDVIPLGTAYAIWTGIGAGGTVIVGMTFFGEPVTSARVILITLLIGAVIGLKFVSAA